MTINSEQIQALKAQMKRKHRDWSGSVMRTCDCCGHYKYTVMEDGGRVAKCASCCDGEHATDLANVAETLLADHEADKALIEKVQADATQWKEVVDAFCSDEVEWHKLTNSSNELISSMSTLICKQADRIAELEARTRTVKLPSVSFFYFKTGSAFASGAYVNVEAMNKELAAAGITLDVGE